MSAKPKTRNDIENLDAQLRPSKEQRYEGQDIFVDDDPATKLNSNSGKTTTEMPCATSPLANDSLKMEKLTYIHQMLGELRKLSITLDEPMVAYLLEMALLEADTALNVGHFRMDLGSKDKGISGL